MTKAEMVKVAVKQDVWVIFKKVYAISTPEPSSEKQEQLLEEVGKYLAEKLAAALTREQLESMLDKGRPA